MILIAFLMISSVPIATATQISPTLTSSVPTIILPIKTPLREMNLVEPSVSSAQLVPTTTTISSGQIKLNNPKKYSVKYTVMIKNSGFNSDKLQIYLPMPSEWDAQKDIKLGQISPPLTSQETEKNSGNAMVYWELNQAPKINTTQDFTLQFDLTTYETKTSIDPASVKPNNTGSTEYKHYTKPEKYIESDDPKIIQLANKLAGNETNPYRLAKIFYNFIIDNSHYKLLGQGLNGAKYLLDTGNGECGDYSALFIALSRVKGIPARPVVGFWAISGNNQTHVWAEFYLDGAGWIPVDATIGQQSTDKHTYYFGNMDNRRVILSKGFNIPLNPPGPDGYIAPLLQVPLWWYWGSGDDTKMSMDRNWQVTPTK